MKKLLTLIFSVLFICVFSQKVISGKVTDDTGKPIPSASVTIENPENQTIIAYGISDTKGNYKIDFNTSLTKILLKVKAFNQKTVTRETDNMTQSVNFKLIPEITEIKEVVLKTKLITKKGDTISYDLKAFSNKNDRVLADVLKKIPGIEVSSDGTIQYQGNPINKFYVNGKDLMEGGYGTVNNALPIESIAKVDVMENHQPVKILQDKVPSDAAAINVKLKSSVTMTGRGEVGAGFNPFLWNVKLTPMLFAQKTQWLINYKANNNGESVENEGNILSFGNRFEGVRKNISQNKWLGVENAPVPNLPEKRYLLNNVHYLSANLLTNLNKSKEWELKANASYTNNSVSREAFSSTTYYTSAPYSYYTDIKNNFYTDKAKGELIFTKNAKEGFFKNVTTFSQFWNSNRADVDKISDIGNQTGKEALQLPTSSFQNSLSAILPINGKLFNVRSFVSYQNDKQTLEISPGNYINASSSSSNPFNVNNTIQQYMRLKTLDTENAINLGFSVKNWTITPELGFNITNNTLYSVLNGISSNSFLSGNALNHMQFMSMAPYTSLGINYKNTSLMLNINLPVNFNDITAQDSYNNLNKSLNKTTFEPSFFAQYEFASFWKAYISGNINYSFGDVSTIYAAPILLSPANFSILDPKNPISQTLAKSTGTRIEYRNPLNNLFFNVSYRYSNTDRNLLGNSNIASNGFTQITYTAIDNGTYSNSESAEIGKYFPKLKTNISVSFSNSDSNSWIDNNTSYLNKNNTQSLGFKFNTTKFSWMSIDYNMSYGWGKRTSLLNVIKSNSFNHNLNLIFYPIEHHSIGLNWDQINAYQQGNSYNNSFYDITYQYSWTKKKIDFEFKWLNIGNRKIYETISNGITNIALLDENEKAVLDPNGRPVTVPVSTTTVQKINIRPSQFMFTVKFNFK